MAQFLSICQIHSSRSFIYFPPTIIFGLQGISWSEINTIARIYNLKPHFLNAMLGKIRWPSWGAGKYGGALSGQLLVTILSDPKKHLQSHSRAWLFFFILKFFYSEIKLFFFLQMQTFSGWSINNDLLFNKNKCLIILYHEHRTLFIISTW